MSLLTQVHYDKPRSHSNSQTRFIIPRNRRVYTPSIQMLGVTVNPNRPCYFPMLVGCYSLVKNVQVNINSVPSDVWKAQQMLPWVVSQFGDNEKQRGIVKELYLTGNNLVYDAQTETMTIERPLVDSQTASMKMIVYSDLLLNLGVCNEEIEIIIDWETNLSKCLISVDAIEGGSKVTSVNILPPYLVYETFNMDISQPTEIVFRKWVEERMAVPSTAANVLQTVELRSNAFNDKTISRMLISSLPASLNNSTPNLDASGLYCLCSSYLSVPMVQESFNIAKNGETLLSLRNVNNDSLKLGMTNDIWGSSNLVSGAHLHLQNPMLVDLSQNFVSGTNTITQLSGFGSFGCVDISEKITKDVQFSYRRQGVSAYPTLSEQMLLCVDAEVNCLYKDGRVSYI